jgi:hypothetical protein
VSERAEREVRRGAVCAAQSTVPSPQELADRAAAEPVAGVLAIPAHRAPRGTRHAYAAAPGAFADFDSHTGQPLGLAVADVIEQINEHDRVIELVGQLEEALRSRAVIDQAKGIIIARYACSPDEASQRLVKVSRTKNITLRELPHLRGTERATPRPSTSHSGQAATSCRSQTSAPIRKGSSPAV